MFERFTERARKVMSLARLEAQRLNAVEIGTEHMMLGIIQEGGGVASKVLKNMEIDLKRLRQEIDKRQQVSTSSIGVNDLKYSESAVGAISNAERWGARMAHDVVGTEHVLLGLIEEKKGLAAIVLFEMGVKVDEVRDMVLEVLGVDVDVDTGTVNTEVLPAANDVKGVMNEVSRLVEEQHIILGKFAQEYGVHGQVHKTANVDFMITRVGDQWGVFVTRPYGTGPQPITGCRLEEKIEFLSIVGKMKKKYCEQIVRVFNQAKMVLNVKK